MATSDPFRADAATVYRAMQLSGKPVSAADLAAVCFPLTFGPDDPLYPRLVKASLRKVYDSLVWMRHNGVVITALPTVDQGTVFVLGSRVVVATPSLPPVGGREGVVVKPRSLVGAVRETNETMSVWGHDDET